MHPKMQSFRVLARALLLSQCLLLLLSLHVQSSPPPEPIKCPLVGSAKCTVTNAYGTFPDRSTCYASSVVYPTSEEEVVKAVAAATAIKKKMKVVTSTVHSIPKLSCPGGDDGLIISTKYLRRVVSVDATAMVMTVEGGMTLRELIAAAAKAGLALPHGPYWWGVTVGGLLATGAHGSSMRGKGSAVHEYVVGIRIVTPGKATDGYATVRSIGTDHPDMDAVKVSLGVLGVVTQVTLKLQPMFKRSITNVMSDDTDLAERAIVFGNEHEFADIEWYPGQRKVFYRKDDRVANNVPGAGRNDFIGFRPTPTAAILARRLLEEAQEATANITGKCLVSRLTTSLIAATAFGLTNNGLTFTGYPVVGYQNNLQSSGSCLIGPQDALLTVCPWDPRVKGEFYHQTTISIGISKARNFILDIQKLRDLNPDALCGVELYNGILIRYVKASTAYMGKQEDSLDFDITYYRAHNPGSPRDHEDVMEEVEQMGLYKYGGLPHWGKNRNLAFDGVVEKYAKSGDFLKVKGVFDPQGLFSNEWMDQVLGINGTTSIYKNGCALEGLCVCSTDAHCAPEKGYLCRPGRVYTDARVCRRDEPNIAAAKVAAEPNARDTDETRPDVASATPANDEVTAPVSGGASVLIDLD